MMSTSNCFNNKLGLCFLKNYFSFWILQHNNVPVVKCTVGCMYRFSEHTSSTTAWKIFLIPSYHGYISTVIPWIYMYRPSYHGYTCIIKCLYLNMRNVLLKKLSSKIPLLHSTLKLNAGNGNWYQISSSSDFKIITWFTIVLFY